MKVVSRPGESHLEEKKGPNTLKGIELRGYFRARANQSRQDLDQKIFDRNCEIYIHMWFS
jgi:hypothetical protein